MVGIDDGLSDLERLDCHVDKPLSPTSMIPRGSLLPFGRVLRLCWSRRWVPQTVGLRTEHYFIFFNGRRYIVAVTRRTRLSVVAASALLTAGLSGCGVVSPDMTAEDYAPGDGTMIMIDDVRGLSLMIVTEAERDQGTPPGAVANRGFRDQRV